MATTEKRAVHFGAGNIGRGFVACFLHESGYHVTFADVMDNVVDQLNKTPSYKVNEVGVDGGDTKTITNYRAINSKYNEAELIDEISTSDVVTCSVGPNILKFIAPVIAQAIAKRSDSMKPLAVIACENMIGATSELAKYIHKYTEEKISKASLDSHHLHAAYANSAIDRIVPAQDPNAGLDVTLEQFYEWVVEELPFNGECPSIDGIKWTDNLKPFIERKLFTVNTSHATAAYFGYNRNKKTVDDAMLDKDIRAQVNAAINETASILVKKHGIPKADQDAYKEKIIKRISNPHLADAVERVGRAPLRKLGRNERFIGPAFELAEADMKCTALLEAAEMVFRFQNVEGDDESKELATIMAEKSADDVAKEVCGLNSSDKLYPMVVEVIKKVQNDRD